MDRHPRTLARLQGSQAMLPRQQASGENISDTARKQPGVSQQGPIAPGIVESQGETSSDQPPHDSSGPASFYALRDRLIQQQWQFDREQQWRIEHEPEAFGAFARLPPEIRCQIYRACFPSECLNVDLVSLSGKKWSQGGLTSFMRTTRAIYVEIRPLLERHVQSRLFNLVLSNNGVRFERKQLSIDFLTSSCVQSMTSETFPPLGLFARTRNHICNLRLAIQIDKTTDPRPGLVPALELFAMWIFSLLSRAETLRNLLVEFYLDHMFPAETLTNEDGTEMSLGRLIGVILGVRAAQHSHSVMKHALTSELQVVRFVVHQDERIITSFRWNRSSQPQQPASQPASEQPELSSAQNEPPLTTESETQRTSLAHSPAPQIDDVQPSALATSPAKSTFLDDDSIVTADRNPLQPGGVPNLQISASTALEEARVVEIRPVTLLNEGRWSSIKPLSREPNSQAAENTTTNDSDSSTRLRSSQDTYKRRRKHNAETKNSKRPKLEAEKRLSSSHTQMQPASFSQTFGASSSQSRSSSASNEVAPEDDEYVVQSLRDVRIKDGVPQIKVKWKGYDQTTWEPRATLMEDVPDMVKEFDKRLWTLSKVDTNGNTGIKAGHRLSSHLKMSQGDTTRSNERIAVQSDTPRNANVRLGQWEAHRKSLQSLDEKVADDARPRYASIAPKRPLTAYFLYMQANRPHIAKDLGQRLGHQNLVKEAQISSEGTRRWLALDPDQRAVWERMHAKRVAVYHIQIEAFKAGRPVPSQEEARKLAQSRIDQASVVDLT